MWRGQLKRATRCAPLAEGGRNNPPNPTTNYEQREEKLGTNLKAQNRANDDISTAREERGGPNANSESRGHQC